MHFRYVARDRSGQAHQGRAEGQDAAEVMQRLAGQGWVVVSLEAEQAAAHPTGTTRGKVRMADQVVLLRELATLLSAGVTLSDALPSLAQGYAAHSLGPALEQLHQLVRGGGRVSDGLASPLLRLPPYVLALAQAGEASGQLAQALSEAADQLEHERKGREDLRSALIYPTVLVVAGVLAVLFVFIGVVPRFAPMLRSSRGEVPELSRWVIESGVFLRTHLQAFGLGVGGLTLLLGAAFGQAPVRERLSQALLALPGVGPWLLQAEIGRWATVLGALLANRVPIIEALGLSAKVLRFRVPREGVERAARVLQQGQSLTTALETQAWFPPTRLNLIRVGERSGELPKMLQALGAAQTDAARVMQRRLMGLIEPAAILLIGGVIGVVMVAVMMAVTGINQSVG